ncbi:hypothetical protein [Reinekea blandensis]|uniref:Uncharacterized protein n=1 Tax=Reinekea blandensis MED297 TaxID=314283 RepID=A4BJX1_9GAMM|nr:hypothetical protein [Reinekea blandensis]EAR07572.1 hypothetical protein MED297_00085 [Reinekea sp. MED297] [Reinekea blandensis MED297]
MIRTWFNLRYAMWFPVVWFFMLAPFVIPVVPESVSQYSAIDLNWSLGGQMRDWLLNTMVLPYLPREWSFGLVQWWYSANYLQELGLMVLVSLNLFIPVSFVLFWLISGYMALVNWFNKSRVDAERSIARH